MPINYIICIRKCAVVTQEIKTINGSKYLYLTYYDGESKKKKTIYCGPESSPDAKQKAIAKEIEIITLKIAEYENRKNDLEKQLTKK